SASPAAYPFGREIVHVFSKSRGEKQMRHKQEQRNRSDREVGREIVGRYADPDDCGIKTDEKCEATEADQTHGKTNGHAQRNDCEKQSEPRKANGNGGHVCFSGV